MPTTKVVLLLFFGCGHACAANSLGDPYRDDEFIHNAVNRPCPSCTIELERRVREDAERMPDPWNAE